MAGLTVIAMLIVANVFAAKPADVASAPTDSPTASPVSSLPVFVQETPEPPTPTPTPPPAPTPSPSPTPTIPPTPPPTPTASPTAPVLTAPPATTRSPIPATPAPSLPSVAPTLPPIGLVVVQPVDGSTTSDDVILIEGLAQPGVTITHYIPNWFDQHTIADSQGRWSFTENLAEGQNTIKFRVADDMTTEVAVTVYYQPA